MNMHRYLLKQSLSAMLVLSAVIVTSPALASGKSQPSDAQARHQRDVAACKTAPQGTDRVACLRESSAVRASKADAGVEPDRKRFARNALKRCEPLPEPERSDCVARIQGEGTIRGSVAGGGIYRELVTREVVLPAAPAASGTAASAAK